MIESMRATLLSYLDDFLSRGDDTAFAYRRGLRLSRWSYGRVARSAFQFARELESRGVGAGDRVVLWAGNSPAWVACFFGCLVRGTVVVPLDVQSEPGFVSRVVDQVEPRLVVLDAATGGGAPTNTPAIRMDELGSLLSRHSAEPYAVTGIDRDNAAEIVFTSGTTGEPKGVRISHRNLLANLGPLEQEIARYLKYERLVHPLRFLNLLPLSHIFGQLMGVFVPQLLGGEVFFQESLGAPRIIDTVKRERISVLIAVPRILDVLREKIERDYETLGRIEKFRRSLESARGRNPLRRWWEFRAVHSMFGWKFWAFISGGATLAPDAEEFWDRLGFAVIQGYGMTETASIVSVNHPFKMVRGSIGKIMPGQEVRLAPDGEILVRGDNVSRGYWKAPNGFGVAGEGWFRTGDVGEMDAEGNLRFKGRKKDVIVTAAGMKVYPEDLERVLDRDPEVKASVVVSVAGPGGPEPLAVLILRHPNADARAVVERANRSLAQHQRVRRWFIWPDEDFPRSSTQKVRTQLVAERAAAALSGSSRPEATPSRGDGHSGAIDEIISRVGGEAAGRPDSASTLGTDLKLDSLGRVELASALEDRYQIEIDEAAFTDSTTLGDIERMIHEGVHEEAISYPYPRWQERPPLRWLRVALLYALVLPATRILGRPRIRGIEHLRAIHEPVVFVANHVTEADHALVMAAIPARFRNTLAIAMDGEILRRRAHPSPETGFFKRLLYPLEYAALVFFFNVFSMPHKSGFRRSFEFAGETMDRGRSILVFPEGRHTENGTMNPFMPGTGLLISGLDAPVIPIRIDGLWELKQAKRHRARAGEISVVIGESVRYSPHDAPERIASDLEERVKLL
jgi:long-chain acyl-CoA synthetase